MLSECPAKAGLGIASVGRYEAPKLLTGTPTREKKLTTLAQAADGTKMGPLLSAADSHADHLVGLATCNNAEKVGDTIVANEVEYKMFQATGWKFTSSDGVSPVVLTCGEGNAHIVHQRNDFCHSRMTQSVIVEKPCGTKEIYVKGSFETVAAFCKPESLPADYASVAQRHALAGCYVLALAKRVLGTQVRRIVFLLRADKCSRGLRGRRRAATHRNGTLTEITSTSITSKFSLSPRQRSPLNMPMDRDDMERDLTFQGLIIFRNELRDDSAATIAKLKVRVGGCLRLFNSAFSAGVATVRRMTLTVTK